MRIKIPVPFYLRLVSAIVFADIACRAEGETGSVFFDDEQGVDEFVALVNDEISSEKSISEIYWRINSGYNESFAKEIAGYGEAYKFHCTYPELSPEWIPKEEVRTNCNAYVSHYAFPQPEDEQ